MDNLMHILAKDHIELTIGKKKMAVSKTDIGLLGTAENIKAALATTFGGQLDDLFVHVNRDKSVAVATGAAPIIWPEDRPKDISDVTD